MSKNNSNTSNKDKTLMELIHIIYNRKWVLIISVLITVCIAIIFSFRSTPQYEANVILKKEMGSKGELSSDFMEIVRMQTQDEVDTEIELVKTVEVISKVVSELYLFVNYDRPQALNIDPNLLQNVFSNEKVKIYKVN